MKSVGQLERWNGSFPGPHEYSSLENLIPDDQNPAIQQVHDIAGRLTEKWNGNQFAGLYLHGGPGLGKTHAAIGLGRALHDAGADVFYRYAREVSGNDGQWHGGSGWSRKDIPFPSSCDPETRNPRRVLIFDDYRPENQRHFCQAVDAAAQYGGFMIVTSNYDDPFKWREVPDNRSDREIAEASIIRHLSPDAANQIRTRRQKAAEDIAVSLSSRIASGFKFVHFQGEDRRLKDSFWA